MLKIEMPRRILLMAAEACAAVADAKSPMFGCRAILISAGGGGATAQTNAITRAVRVALSEPKIDKPGDVAVDAKAFLDRVRQFPEGPVALEAEKDKLWLRGGKTKYWTPTLVAEDVPDWPKKHGGEKVELKTGLFGDAVARASRSADDPMGSANLAGVILHFGGKDIVVAASDKHQVHWSPVADVVSPGIKTPRKVLLPISGAAALVRMIGGADELATLTLGPSSITIELGDTEIVLALAGADPAGIEALVERRLVKHTCLVDRLAFLAAVKAVELATEKESNKDGKWVAPEITLSVADGTIGLAASSVGAGEAESSCPSNSGSLGNVPVRFNARLLLGAIGLFDAPVISIDSPVEAVCGYRFTAPDSANTWTQIVAPLADKAG